MIQTDTIISRLRKEGRYSALTTLTMNMVKEVDRKMYQDEKEIAKTENINRQKNYFIIVMRICRTYSYLVDKMEKTTSEAVNYIKTYLLDRLESQIEKKYKDQIEFIVQVKEKNKNDLVVLMNTLGSNLQSFLDVRSQLQRLYQSKSLRQHSKQLSKLANLFIKYSKKPQIKILESTLAAQNNRQIFSQEFSGIEQNNLTNMEMTSLDRQIDLESDNNIGFQFELPIFRQSSILNENSLFQFDSPSAESRNLDHLLYF